MFGDDLQAYCDELIAALPKPSLWEQLSIPLFITSYLLAIYFAVSSVIALVFPYFQMKHVLNLYTSISFICLHLYCPYIL